MESTEQNNVVVENTDMNNISSEHYSLVEGEMKDVLMQVLLVVMHFLMWKYGNEQGIKVIATQIFFKC